MTLIVNHVIFLNICSILHRLWNVVIGVVQARLVVIPRRPSVLYLYKRLEYFMFELKDFFHADGDGMSLTDLGTDAYQVSRNAMTYRLRTASQ